MTRRAALQKLFHDMRADIEDYQRLRQLLQEQFEAAVRHRTEQVRELVERISGIATVLEARRRERVALVRKLAPRAVKPTIEQLSSQLQGPARASFDRCWTSLYALLEDCKRLNERNCHLLMEQHDIMDRVLKQVVRGENTQADTYAPA